MKINLTLFIPGGAVSCHLYVVNFSVSLKRTSPHKKKHVRAHPDVQLWKARFFFITTKICLEN